MIGVLVATHGEMAKGLFDAIDMICGTQEKFSIVSLKRGQDAESFGEELGEKINELKAEYPVYGGNLLIGQAERVDGMTTNVMKSSRSILMNSNYSSPRLQPAHAYHIVFNTIGGDSWKTPGDAVTWEIEVPEKGLYQLSFTARQNINRGSVSYRRLKVNGEVPFKEANSIGFPYSTEFVNYIIGDENGAYLIPLEQGKNTITFETVLG